MISIHDTYYEQIVMYYFAVCQASVYQPSKEK